MKIRDAICSEKTLGLCSIGSGTGGDLLGCILALSKHGLINDDEIRIVSIDGNSNALSMQQAVLEEASRQLDMRLNLKPMELSLPGSNPFAVLEGALANEESFNIITCSKMVNELIQSQKLGDSKCYYDALSVMTSCMGENGIAVISDVVLPIDENADDPWMTTYPAELNRQANRFISRTTGIGTLLPQTCFGNESRCGGYFAKKSLGCVHSRNEKLEKGRIGKFWYRVFGSEALARIASESLAIRSGCMSGDKCSRCSYV